MTNPRLQGSPTLEGSGGSGTFPGTLVTVPLWAASTFYAANSLVLQNHFLYECNADHTSASTFTADSSFWTPLVASTGASYAAPGVDGFVGGTGGTAMEPTIPYANRTDLLGRTGILTTTNDPEPAIASTVSVTDAPWGAKCDAKVVTDGAITTGTNSLTSPTATFAVNQLVVVAGAGPNVNPGNHRASVGGVLIGYVKTVVGTTVTLVTTKGGSTAANASNTVTGATVRYGTDDTAAVQAAINAVSATASLVGAVGTVGLVKFPENTGVMLGSILAKSNVMLWMYGTTIHLATTNANSSGTSMLFTCGTSNVSISNFHIRGGFFVGNNTECGSSGSQSVIYWSNSGFGQNGTATYTDISIMDTTTLNWATGVFDIRGGSRIRIQNNNFRTCGTNVGTNVINVIAGGGTSPVNSSDVFIISNYLDGVDSEGIAVAEATNPSGTISRAIIVGNIVSSTVTTGSTMIDIEWSTVTTGQGKQILISNNIVTQNGTAGYGIQASQVAMPLNFPAEQDVQVTDNIIISTDGGLNVSAQDGLVARNDIHCSAQTVNGILVSAEGTTLSITADMSSSTTLNNVAVSSGTALNGMPLSGANVQAGTYLVSGAGTATWTISLPTTITALAQPVTGRLQVQRCDVLDNKIHVTSNYLKNPMLITANRDAHIGRNKISVDPGATLTGLLANGILVQYCGWCDVYDNRIMHAAGSGIVVDSSNDVVTSRNRVIDPNEANGTAYGISYSNISGLPFLCKDNILVDDRAVHLMTQGVNISGTNGLCELVSNEIRGAVTPTATVTSFALVRGNISDSNTFPAATSAATVGASPYTTGALPYPAMVAVTGGTVTVVSQNRPGSSTRTLASYASAAANVTAYLAPGDTITVTYTVAPTVNVFPLQ